MLSHTPEMLCLLDLRERCLLVCDCRLLCASEKALHA